MKHLLRGCAVIVLGAVLSSAVAAPRDDKVLAARDAFRVGNQAKLMALQTSVQGHVLAAYVDYWATRVRLETLSTADIDAFQHRWPDTFVAERLRLDWVKLLGKRQQWEQVTQTYAMLEEPDQEATCYRLQSRLVAKDDGALDEAASLWRSETEVPDACQPVLDALVATRPMSTNEVWARVRRLMSANKMTQAQATVAYLKAEDRPDIMTMAEVVASPQQVLDRLPNDVATQPTQRQLAMIALGRLARTNPLLAAQYLEGWRKNFSADERAYVYGQLGWQGALQHLSQATAWYMAATATPLTNEQIAWKARAALFAGDWQGVRDSIQSMSASMAIRPEWTYWLGRALKAQGLDAEARELFQQLAGQPSFYGNLADEELGRRIDVPPQLKPSPDEIKAAALDPGILRALALDRLGMRTEGTREWAWTLRHADDHYLLAAATVAEDAGRHDRAINAADRTVAEHDYSMRYLAPYRSQVRPAVLSLNLDEAWVYGLMRQESRFVTDARSGVGAKGLMQVMPSTAEWIAHKLGVKAFNVSDMADMNTNVLLGTNYMKMVLERLDNSPVLASAGYNAGPNRARRWCDARPQEGAVYVETIPVVETRDYVKKVMSNAVYYATLFEQKPQSLKARLGIISPKSATAGNQKKEELPQP